MVLHTNATSDYIFQRGKDKTLQLYLSMLQYRFSVPVRPPNAQTTCLSYCKKIAFKADCLGCIWLDDALGELPYSKTTPVLHSPFVHGGRFLGLFLPYVPLKTDNFRPQTQLECVKCDETWQGSKLINHLLIGFCHSMWLLPWRPNDLQIWHQNYNSGKKW